MDEAKQKITRESVFCPRCGFVLAQSLPYRMLGWFSLCASVCPKCGYIGFMRLGFLVKSDVESNKSF